MNRTRLFLILAVLLAVAISYAWLATPRQQRVSDRVSSRDNQSSVAKNKVPIENEPLDFSGGEQHPFKKPLRDLFQKLYTRPKVKKKRVVVAPPPPPPPKPVIAPPPVIVTPPPAGPKPIPPLNVLGYLQKDGVITVFLSTRQGEVYIVKKGERFANDLLVRDLDARKIIISRGPNDPGQTLMLGEAKSQRMKVIGVPSSRPNVPIIQNFDQEKVMPESAGAQPNEAGDSGANPTGQ